MVVAVVVQRWAATVVAVVAAIWAALRRWVEAVLAWAALRRWAAVPEWVVLRRWAAAECAPAAAPVFPRLALLSALPAIRPADGRHLSSRQADAEQRRLFR